MAWDFHATHGAYEALMRRKRDLMRRMEDAYRDELHRAYKTRFPKRKKPDMEKLGKAIPEEVERIKDRWMPRAERVSRYAVAREERFKRVLRRLARDVPVSAGDAPLHFETVWRSTYSTQGWGADRYARNAAQAYVDKAVQHGLRAEVERVEDEGSVRYEVYAWVVRNDLDLLRHKPEVPLRDWLKACWKRGVNPRVYCPFLPHGLEEKLGVDYHGNDVLRPIRQRTRKS
jgi:hypothetical protein